MPTKTHTKPSSTASPATGRFVVSHRRAGHKDAAARIASRTAFDRCFAKALSRSIHILGDSIDFDEQPDDSRRVIYYDPDQWQPAMSVAEPRAGFWPIELPSPESGVSINLPALPRTGPMCWWQAMAGSTDYLATRGQGIRVGLVDTGVGRHPYLSHVQGIGAFIGGRFLPGAPAGQDSQNHGTHVAGIIGARPAEGSGDFGGIAAGADLLAARVFDAAIPAHQGDIANAIEALAGVHQADFINLSLGGAYSEIERDAVRWPVLSPPPPWRRCSPRTGNTTACPAPRIARPMLWPRRAPGHGPRA